MPKCRQQKIEMITSYTVKQDYICYVCHTIKVCSFLNMPGIVME